MIMQRKSFASRTLGVIAAAMVTGATMIPPAVAGPGDEVSVQPIATGRADQYFQNFIVQIGLERLGYEVKEHLEAQYPAMHLAIGQGDADYMATHWDPLHAEFYERAGGDDTLQRHGQLIQGAAQGYLIDKATADKHGITNLGQLSDPEIAALFDSDGDGKANLSGCNPGWGCEAVIEHQLDVFELRETVTHDQGEYFALMANTMARHDAGDPILYYTWTPLWVSSLLRPGEETVWLDVPFSSLPGDRSEVDTATPDGRNLGFETNAIRVLTNKEFSEANPAAVRFFELLEIPIGDVNAAILRQKEGEDKIDQIRGHAEEWVSENAEKFDVWIAEAEAVE